MAQSVLRLSTNALLLILLLTPILPVLLTFVSAAEGEPPYIPYEVVLYSNATTYTGHINSYITVTVRTEKGADIDKTVSIPWDGYGVAAAILLGIKHVSTKLATTSGERLSLIAGVGAAFYTKGSKHEYTVQNGDYYYHVIQEVSVVPIKKYYFTGKYGEIIDKKTFKVYASSEQDAKEKIKAELEFFGIGGGITIESVSRIGVSSEYAVTVSYPIVKYYSDVIFKGSFVYSETVITNAPVCPLSRTNPISVLGGTSPAPLHQPANSNSVKYTPATSCTHSTSKDFDIRYGYTFYSYEEINK